MLTRLQEKEDGANEERPEWRPDSKGSNTICLNAMKRDFNYETVLLSLDIIYCYANINTRNFSSCAATAKKEKELNEVGTQHYCCY